MSTTIVKPAAISPRTQAMLQAPIVPMLLTMAWPNVLVMLAQSSSGLIETYWVSRLGTDALAGMAVVFPGVMLMQMISAGALGGGISSAIARALGGRRQADADALVLHALVLNALLGGAFSIALLVFGPQLYRLLGASGPSLDAALAYSDVVFAGTVLLWLSNGLASVVRGTGNMLLPAMVTIGGVALLVPLSPCLIFGLGPFPRLGVAGAGWAMVVYYAGSAAVLAAYVAAERVPVRLRLARLRWALFWDILAVGLVATLSTLQTNLTIVLATGLIGASGGPGAIAGYGTGTRLEYLLIPLTFGLGAPLVALVGTNMGAGQIARAMRITWIGAGIAFVMAETIGLAAAIFPGGWLGLFGDDPAMLATGSSYLRTVGPVYGCFGFGMALYFASQGAGRLLWPLMAGLLRMTVSVAGGWAAMHWFGSIEGLFVSLALGMTLFGAAIATAIRAGAWRTQR